MPSSSSHALIGGLIGAALADGGWNSLGYATILNKILLPLVLSPALGFAGGYILMVGLCWLLARAKPSLVNSFRKLQILSSAFMAVSHNLNDAQKSMGVISLALYIFHFTPEIVVPLWAKLACALAMGLGTAAAAGRSSRPRRAKIFKLEPVHGFAAETPASWSSWPPPTWARPSAPCPRHFRLGHRGGRLQALVRRALGRGRRHDHRLDPDPARRRRRGRRLLRSPLPARGVRLAEPVALRHVVLTRPPVACWNG